MIGQEAMSRQNVRRKAALPRRANPIQRKLGYRKSKASAGGLLDPTELQQRIGNQGALHLLQGTQRRSPEASSNPVQAKPLVGRPDDALEREADRLGRKAASGQSVAKMPRGITDEQIQSAPLRQGEEEEEISLTALLLPENEEEEEEEETVRRKPDGPAAPRTESVANSAVDMSGSGGHALPESTRSFFESRFGNDFSQVRVHSDTRSDKAAESINAQAFTRGHDIYFAQGHYRPDSSSGRELIAHELTHVVQQKGKGASQQVQRKPAEGTDPETLLGQRLWKECPDGVAVAFYDTEEPVAKKAAEAWAKTVKAIAPGRGKVSAKNLEFGKPIPDSRNMANTLVAMGKVIKSAVTKTAPSDVEMLGGKPGSVQRRRTLSPAKIRTLAIFAHGSERTCWIGKGVNRQNAEATVKKLAPYLASDVKILIFACSTATGPKEYKTVREEWIKGTMEKGGKGSLSAKVRDALVKHGKMGAQVWGHTTGGHVSRNPALRVFYSKRGAGSLGESYVASYIFTPTIIKQIATALKSEITTKGYAVTDERRYTAKAEAMVSLEVYRCWISAAKKRKHSGRPLAEMAPNFPYEVANIVLKYWKSTWWPRRKEKLAKRLIRRLGLKKE